MRVFGILIGLFVSSAAMADFPFMYTCVTAPRPTLNVIIVDKGDTVSFQYYNSNQADQTPIQFGQVVAGQLDYFERLKTIGMKLGKGFIAQFPKNKCHYHESGWLRCENYQAEPIQVGNSSVSVFSVFTEIQLSRSWAGEFQTIVVNVNMKIDGDDFILPIAYDHESCRLIEKEGGWSKPTPRISAETDAGFENTQ